MVKLVKAVGVPVKGGYDDTCKGTFGMSFAAGADVAEEDGQRVLQGIISDMAIDARDCDAGPFPSPNPIVGCKSVLGLAC